MIVGIFLVVISTPFAVFAGRYFGSKTPYDLTYTDWEALVKEAQLPATCQLIHLRLVARHGSRSYDEDKAYDVEKAVADLTKAFSVGTAKNIGRTLTEKQIQDILRWKNQLPPTKELLDRGKAEHRFLADNYYNLIKTSAVLSKAASFRFESTNVSRAQQSAQAFKDELAKLFRRGFDQPIKVNDRLLYYHKNCQAYRTRVAKNKTVEALAIRAKSTKEGASIVDKINRGKLGLAKNVLSWKDIFAIYGLTAVEVSALNSSVFQPLFDDEDLAYIEYVDDLEQYWAKAYSTDRVTRDMSCILTGDMFQSARQAYEQHQLGKYVESAFGFAHLEVILPIYGAFGLFHDSEAGYLADASRYFYTKRKYDTSEIGKMASNIAFLFYNCPSFDEPQDKLVIMMVNGQAQPLPRACPYQIPCPFEKVQEAYPLATGYPAICAFEQICSLESSAPHIFISLALIMICNLVKLIVQNSISY